MRQCFCSLQGLKTRPFFYLCRSVALSYIVLLNFQSITIQGLYDRFLAGKTDSAVGHITKVLPLSRSILSPVAAWKCSEVVNIVERLARNLKFYPTIVQKVIIEKSRGGRFLWNRNWDLGWIWADWHYWKKNWDNFEQLLSPVFSCFHGKKKYIL